MRSKVTAGGSFLQPCATLLCSPSTSHPSLGSRCLPGSAVGTKPSREEGLEWLRDCGVCGRSLRPGEESGLIGPVWVVSLRVPEGANRARSVPGLDSWSSVPTSPGVCVAGGAGCRASTAPRHSPQSHCCSSRGIPRWPQLLACPFCLCSLWGWRDLPYSPGAHSTARALAAPLCRWPPLPSSLINPSSAPPPSGAGPQLSGSLGAQSGGR